MKSTVDTRSLEIAAIGGMIRKMRESLGMSKDNPKKVGTLLSAAEAHCAWRLVFETYEGRLPPTVDRLRVKLAEVRHPDEPPIALTWLEACALFDLLFDAVGEDGRKAVIGKYANG